MVEKVKVFTDICMVALVLYIGIGLLDAMVLLNNTNYLFSKSNSPYYIENTLHFTETSNVVIENGVEIIFMKNNIYIQFDGHLNCGCHKTANNNTSTSEYIYIHGSNELDHIDSYIKISNSHIKKDIRFCDTKFENLYYGIYIVNPFVTNTTINHCIFNTIQKSVLYSENEASGIENISNSMTYISDSIIRNVLYIQTNQFGAIIYDNMDMEYHYGFCGHSPPWHWQDTRCYDFITIKNSNLLTSDPQHSTCLMLSSYSIIYNNKISDCRLGISTSNGVDMYISNNTFTNINGQYVIVTDTLNGAIINNVFNNNNVTGSIIMHSHEVNSTLMVKSNQIVYNYVARSFVYLCLFGGVSTSYQMSSTGYIKNNIFSYNHISGDFVYSWAPVASEYSQLYNIYIEGNIFEHNQYYHPINTGRVIGANVNKLHLNDNVFINNTFECDQAAKYSINLDSSFFIVAQHVKWNHNTFHDNITVYYGSNDWNSPVHTTNLIMQYNLYFVSVTLDISRWFYNQSNFEVLVNYNNFYAFNQTEEFIAIGCGRHINVQYNYFAGISTGSQMCSKISSYCIGFIYIIPFFSEPITDFDNIRYINDTHTSGKCLNESTQSLYNTTTTEYNTTYTDVEDEKQITTKQLTTEYDDSLTTGYNEITTEYQENGSGNSYNIIMFALCFVWSNLIE